MKASFSNENNKSEIMAELLSILHILLQHYQGTSKSKTNWFNSFPLWSDLSMVPVPLAECLGYFRPENNSNISMFGYSVLVILPSTLCSRETV